MESIIGLIIGIISLLFAIWQRNEIYGFLKNVKRHIGSELISISKLDEELKLDTITVSSPIKNDLAKKHGYVIWPVLTSRNINLIHLSYIYQLAKLESLGFIPVIINMDVYREFSGRNCIESQPQITDYQVTSTEAAIYKEAIKRVIKTNPKIISQRETHLKNNSFIESMLLAASIVTLDLGELRQQNKSGGKTLLDIMYFLLSAASIRTFVFEHSDAAFLILQWEGRRGKWHQLISNHFLPNIALRIIFMSSIQNVEGATSFVTDPFLPQMNDSFEMLRKKIDSTDLSTSIMLQQIYFYILCREYDQIEYEGKKLPTLFELHNSLQAFLKKDTKEITQQMLASLVLEKIDPDIIKGAIYQFLSSYIANFQSLFKKLEPSKRVI